MQSIEHPKTTFQKYRDLKPRNPTGSQQLVYLEYTNLPKFRSTRSSLSYFLQNRWVRHQYRLHHNWEDSTFLKQILFRKITNKKGNAKSSPKTLQSCDWHCVWDRVTILTYTGFCLKHVELMLALLSCCFIISECFPVIITLLYMHF